MSKRRVARIQERRFVLVPSQLIGWRACQPSQFIKINMLLPESSRWEVVPLSKLRATYIRLSEAALFDILHHNTSFVVLMADLTQSTDPRLMKDNLVPLLNDDDEVDADQHINILHNSILTNGFVVKISVIAKGLRKPPATGGLVLADLSQRNTWKCQHSVDTNVKM
ncbi:hypothetical protein SeMB42_g07165 [Synchytrium endobioticum]|uniref:Uncharacterized protein n=1 Tax=Synchytrium endobioticum TaxID=286115 RepID=A0A507C7E2_9FUNG|nr:hypothetical protein SeMB42_g07165 [Synchytrium endobioticum]